MFDAIKDGIKNIATKLVVKSKVEKIDNTLPTALHTFMGMMGRVFPTLGAEIENCMHFVLRDERYVEIVTGFVPVVEAAKKFWAEHGTMMKEFTKDIKVYCAESDVKVKDFVESDEQMKADALVLVSYLNEVRAVFGLKPIEPKPKKDEEIPEEDNSEEIPVE